MPVLPTIMLGLDLSGPSSLPILPTESTIQQNLVFYPWAGLDWDLLSVRTSIHTKQDYQTLTVGAEEYTSQYGITEISFGALPVLYKKNSNQAFLHLGSFVRIPNIDVISEAQTDEESLLIEQQLHTDLFSVGGLMGFGARKYFSQFFVSSRIDQRFTWNPLYSDEFGAGQLFTIQSEVHVTFGWLL